MKLKFDPALGYQNDAISAVVKLFDGQPIAQSNFEISVANGHGLISSELGIGNRLTLDDNQLLVNTRKIQESNGIEKVQTLQGREFSIEMETGTGKTYVYLRSIFELSKTYGLKKFIVVVPSVAIREGVLKSIEMMKGHFCALYDNEPFDYFVYASKKLSRVRQFAISNRIQIMIINIQSFQKDVADADADTSKMTEEGLKKLNVINRESDRMSGRKPIEFIKVANPMVIIDEPQSVDNTDKAKRAIKNLNPIATLRYSATHRNPYNLLYKLDPVRAYDLRLVKRIEVDSVRSDDNFNDAYVKLLKTDNKKGIKAQVEIHKQTGKNIKPAKLWIKQGDDLFDKSGERESYRDGYIVHRIDCTPGSESIEFNNGETLESGREIGELSDDIMKYQVRSTIEQHFKKELSCKAKGIKVLSLFFVDRVANYRIYNDDGSTSLGKIGRWFEEAYNDLTSKLAYKKLATDHIEKIHDGYFSKDRRGQWKNSSTGSSIDDDKTYNLIMRDKERLLDLNQPLRFIFSHSALREGWDNPNVFQICTLNESASTEKKRQEIGRGLRLPVNQSGERVHDENINRLTIIANESYEDFARSLQNEMEDDLDIKFGYIGKVAFAKILREKSSGEKTAIGQEESAKIWQELRDGDYIDGEGKILDKFDPNNRHFKLEISNKYDDIKDEVIDEMKEYIFKNRVVNVRERRTLKLNKQVQLSPEFKGLWSKIKQRTRYRVAFETSKLIECASERIKKLARIRAPRVVTTRVGIDISVAGVSAGDPLEEKSHEVDGVRVLPDILAYLQKETELTRHTLVKILKQSGRLSDFQINPQRFMSSAAQEIQYALRELMLSGIQYEKVDNYYWDMQRIEKEAESGIVRYLNNLYEVQNQNKCLFDMIEFDSEIEKQFAKDLDANEHIRLFVKLPSWFKIDTPIGPYNPDWAFVTERDEKLYFVRETKSSTYDGELRVNEHQKIQYGERHFESIGVNYDVVKKLSDVQF